MKSVSSARKRQILFRGTVCAVLVYTFALASYTVRIQLGPHAPPLRVLLWGVIGTAASVALFISLLEIARQRDLRSSRPANKRSTGRSPLH